jgi:transcriptional regulator with XRE-family HTH domain
VILYLQQSHFNYFPLHSYFTHTAKEIVGKRIKILRTQKNMTLQQLADEIKVDRQYVWNIENGEVNLTLDYIDRIAAALKVSQLEFINTNI